MRRWPDATRFVAVCGGGKNGGDGRIAAELLRAAGKDAEVADEPRGAEVVVDALFGTGFHGEPRPDAARLIEAINDPGRGKVVAVDIASGVNASTGEVSGVAVRADLSVTFHGRKVGHEVSPGRFHAGEVVVADIGLEPIETRNSRATTEILSAVPRRSPEDNKYTAGHVVVVGGSPGMTGAPYLSALAALRADAGYVALAGPKSAIPVFEHWVIEGVKRPLPEDDEGLVTADAVDDVLDLAGKGGALAIGPGLGRSEGTKERPARPGGGRGARGGRRRRSPRAGAARVAGAARPDAALGRARPSARRRVGLGRRAPARGARSRSRAVRLHRPAEGRRHPGGGNTSDGRDRLAGGDPALATAGTGDVLTGIVAAFLAKGVEPRLAVAAAAVAHTEAARQGYQKNGLIASDLIEALPRVLAA